MPCAAARRKHAVCGYSIGYSKDQSNDLLLDTDLMDSYIDFTSPPDLEQ